MNPIDPAPSLGHTYAPLGGIAAAVLLATLGVASVAAAADESPDAAE